MKSENLEFQAIHQNVHPGKTDVTTATPESADGQLSAEQEEQARYWMGMQKEIDAASRESENAKAAEKERVISKLNELFDIWLVAEKLEPLRVLQNPTEAMASPLRAEAKLVLAEILQGIRTLSESLPFPEIGALQKKYRLLSQAVGIIRADSVDHTR